MRVEATELLAFHRALVATPSVSGDERAAADLAAGWLAERLPAEADAVDRLGHTLLAIRPGAAPHGPLVLLDSHLDTVPPAPGWTREPFLATVEEGRVYGLGSNDAKAAAAAMAAAFVELGDRTLPFALGLALVEQEETRGLGTERALAEIERRGLAIAGAIVGEPTGLDVAVAQKGLLVLELTARGDACHAAHAAALGGRNAAREIARDLIALEAFDLGPPHPDLGPITVEPTLLAAGTAKNVVPGVATATLDVRSTPNLAHAEIAARIAAAVRGEVRIVSERLRPRATPAGSPPRAAARAARPEARYYGSPTISDWALLDAPAIKVGPGESARSHRADEYVDEAEVVAGARFYVALLEALAARWS